MSTVRCVAALLVACALLMHGASAQNKTGDPVRINSRIWKCNLNATQLLSENAACNLSILTNGSSVTLAPKTAM
jgi:hypothetical protein